jgi:hypothetical protein
MAAKFMFPMTFDQFKASVKDASAFKGLGAGEGDALAFAFSCLRQGWMSKQYHKDSQGTRNEELSKIRKWAKENPEKAKAAGIKL